MPLYNPQIIHSSILLNLDSKSQPWADFILSIRCYNKHMLKAKQNLGQFCSLKFFRSIVWGYFGVTFLTKQENIPTFSTYRQF